MRSGSPLRGLKRIFPRLLLFNVLLVFLPAAGLLYLDTYERQMLRAQERSMVQQGRLLAAALGEQSELDQEEATALLGRLKQRVDARLRVVDRDASLLADSSRLGPQRGVGDGEKPLPDRRDDWFYRIGATAAGSVRWLLGERQAVFGSGDLYDGATQLEGSEIQAALAGRYGAATRISTGGQRSVTLYSAIPIRADGRVVGAVLISQSTAKILDSLVDVRLDIFRIFLLSIAVAVLLGLVFAQTIARPLAELRQRARAIVDQRGRLQGRFEPSRRSDEIGDLSRALESLSTKLEQHQQKLEAYATDLAHELKNPLAAVRTATELLYEVEEPADKTRFLVMVQKDIARMEHALAEVRELTALDRLRTDDLAPIDLCELASEIVGAYQLREGAVTVACRRPSSPIWARIEPEHFTRVLTNLIDNALSFSPPDGRVVVELSGDTETAELSVADQGPGVEIASRERIFDRFYSSRPKGGVEGHLGLGLAIARAIAEGYRGRLDYRDGAVGSLFALTLPKAGR